MGSTWSVTETTEAPPKRHADRAERRRMQRALAKQLGKPASECRVVCDCDWCLTHAV